MDLRSLTCGYDRFGRPNRLRYPEVKGNRLAVKYVYTTAGYLRQVVDDATGSVLWAATAMNAVGQVTDEVLGNGVKTASVRNDATGWLLGRTSTSHANGDAVIQQSGVVPEFSWNVAKGARDPRFSSGGHTKLAVRTAVSS